jgi:beta-lactamase class D
VSRRSKLPAILIAIGLAASCSRADRVSAPDARTQALNAAVETRMGGAEVCVVLADAGSGRIVYQYGRQAICMRQLPPCATFDIANTLIGLDDGKVTPTTALKWDGSPQPVSAWERDADMKAAFRNSIVWWFQRLAVQVGASRYAERLKAFGYGDGDVSGPVTSFWLGPTQGGSLGISAREQAGFLQRLYAGKLPVKPEAAAAVLAVLHDDAGASGVDISGRTGTCRSSPDGSRQTGWWVGRLKTPARDVVFAAVNEGDIALPGAEVEARLRQVFTDVGDLPPQ